MNIWWHKYSYCFWLGERKHVIPLWGVAFLYLICTLHLLVVNHINTFYHKSIRAGGCELWSVNRVVNFGHWGCGKMIRTGMNHMHQVHWDQSQPLQSRLGQIVLSSKERNQNNPNNQHRESDWHQQNLTLLVRQIMREMYIYFIVKYRQDVLPVHSLDKFIFFSIIYGDEICSIFLTGRLSYIPRLLCLSFLVAAFVISFITIRARKHCEHKILAIEQNGYKNASVVKTSHSVSNISLRCLFVTVWQLVSKEQLPSSSSSWYVGQSTVRS